MPFFTQHIVTSSIRKVLPNKIKLLHVWSDYRKSSGIFYVKWNWNSSGWRDKGSEAETDQTEEHRGEAGSGR